MNKNSTARYIFKNIIRNLFFFSIFSIFSNETIDIVSDFPPSDLPINWNEAKNQGTELRLFNKSIQNYVNENYSNNVKKVVFMNLRKVPKNLNKIPKNKRFLFLWEAWPISQANYNLFSCIYTFKNKLIDNSKFRKFYYPYLNKNMKKKLPFEKRKLCTTVIGNWTKERKNIVSFLLKHEPEFEFWGWNPGPYNTKSYKGKIQGGHSEQPHIDTLSKYKFTICFENTAVSGYISEKIFNCFTAGSIPIYWGDPDIKKVIPGNCFIDYASFKNNEELLVFLKKMSEKEYDSYLNNISMFLNSKEGTLFSPEYFLSLIID